MADATISIGADGSAFSRAMKDVAQNTDTMANSITARLARLGQAFEGFGKIKDLAKDVFSAFTAPAGKMEDVATSLGVMTGDMEDARVLADKLNMVAVNGTRSLDELHRASRALSNVYKDSGNIEHWVKVFADIAAGSKVPADRIAEMAARLKDMGKAEFTELANAGIPIFEELSKVMGVSVEEVIKLQSQVGGIQLGDFLTALKNMTAEGAKFHELNATMSNTTKGSYETLQASIEACAAVLGKPINDAMRPVMQDISDRLQKLRPQLETLATSFANLLQNVAALAAPLIEVAAGIAERFTHAERFIATAAAALLVFATNTKHAKAKTLGLELSLTKLARRLMAIKLSEMFSGWDGAVKGAKRIWVVFGVFLKTNWKGICATIAVTFRTAMTAVKSALISTGIGAIIWGIGEGISALYDYFAGVDEEAQESARSVREFNNAFKDLQKRAKNVLSESDINAVLDDAQAQMDELAEKAKQAEKDGNEAAAEQARQHREELAQWRKGAGEQMRAQVQQNKLEAERTAQMKEQARLAEEEAKAQKERLKTVEQMRRARENNDFEGRMDSLRDLPEGLGGGTEAVIRERLKAVQAASEEALLAERDRLENSNSLTNQQLERYKLVSAALEKIAAEHEKEQQAAQKQHEAKTRALDEYYQRKQQYEQQQQEKRYDGLSIQGQEQQLQQMAQGAGYWGELNPEAIRAQLDALASAGAEAYQSQIAQLERVLQLQGELTERKKQYQALANRDSMELQIQALEAQGRQKQADALRREMEMQQRITELRSRGATEEEATKQAQMEQKVKQVVEHRVKMQSMKTELIQGFQASVGGGGVSIRIGNSQLQETKKQSKLLKDIASYTKNAQSGKTATLG